MSDFSGTVTLTRFIFRRDRFVMSAWILGGVLITLVTATAMRVAYPTEHARTAFAAAVTGNPSQLALLGPVMNASVGGLTAWRARAWGAIGLGLAAVFTVIRHTRREEESGRRDLLGATAVGRAAPLAATLIATSLAFALTGALVTAGLTALKLPLAGSIALGIAFALNGWMITAVTAVAAQLTQTARAANGLAASFVGLAYALRGLGDAAGVPALSWLSPFGWTGALRPFAGERVAPAIPALALIAALVLLAFRLGARRDVGAGLFPARNGPATAHRAFRSSIALAWRLQRGTLLGWCLACGGLGAALGGTAVRAAEQLQQSRQLAALIALFGPGARPVDGFWALIFYISGQLIAGYAMGATLMLRTEESGSRAELLLASPVSRARWALGHLVIALSGAALALTALGAGAGLTYGLATGDVAGEMARLVTAAWVRIPAIAIVASIALLAFGLVPRAARGVSWSVLAFFFLLELEFIRQRAGEWVMQLSPFVHVPGAPVAAVSIAPMVTMSAIAAAISALGLLGLQRRDIG